eukprot:1180408-Prorocentrum_minimum.AAC.2
MEQADELICYGDGPRTPKGRVGLFSCRQFSNVSFGGEAHQMDEVVHRHLCNQQSDPQAMSPRQPVSLQAAARPHGSR